MKSGSAKIFHIPAGRPFADDLVRGIRDFAVSPEDLADAVILMPNRRLAASLRTAFLRNADGGSELLPTMMPVGIVEEDAPELAQAGWDRDDLPPMIPALERQLLLANNLVDPSRTMAETMGLAGALADFLDEAQIHDCDLGALGELVKEGDLAVHWQRLLAYLNLLMQWWPEKLKAVGRSDPAMWHSKAVEARAEAWASKPPKGLVVIAGSPGAMRSTRKLIQTVLGLERGMVVLPGVDIGMSDEDWEGLLGGDETAVCHPQHQLADLLKLLEIDRGRIERWPGSGDAGNNPRLDLLREMFRPAGQSGEWKTIAERKSVTRESLERKLQDKSAGGGSGARHEWLKLVECYDRREEAEVIALAMRETLETPGRTAVLATADRVLGRLVIGELSRWGIELEDSAGTGLAETSPAHFLRLILDAWASDFAPRDLMAMLQHPLAASGLDRAEFREAVRQLDAGIRGPRPAGGLKGVLKHLASGKESASLVKFVEERIIKPLEPLTSLNPGIRHGLAECLDALGDAAEFMGRLPDEPLAVWRGQAGARVARFLTQTKMAAESTGTAIDPAELRAVLTVLMQKETIYPDRVGHPRLAVMGLLEARMHSADLVILGGMNEGTSPPQPPMDPWMSNAMRVDFGLPPANWRVGLAAHDIYMAMARPQVLITRAARQEGAPTEPSRWLRRLETVLGVAKLDSPEDNRYIDIAKARNAIEGPVSPAARPRPTADSAARPRRFSATEMDTLLKDPYAIYARRVLGLKALDPLDQAPGPAERGSFVHAALDAFIQRHPEGDLPEGALDELIRIGRDEFEKLPDTPWGEAIWWPQFEAVARWFIDNERSDARRVRRRHAEIKGEMEVEGLTAPYTLTARADRVDILADDSLRIVDYKTGGIPTAKAVSGGRALQLVVEAVLASGGHFPGIDAGKVGKLEYWKLTGRGDKPGEVHDRTLDEDGFNAAEERLIGLLHQFDSDDAAYVPEPVAREANRFSDYKHLARLAEWKISQGEDGE